MSNGIHAKFDLSKFPITEQSVLKRLSNFFQLTNSGSVVSYNGADFYYLLVKPNNDFSNMFNVSRELVCILNRYNKFDARVLDVVDDVFNKFPRNRVEKLCVVLISAGADVATEIKKIGVDDIEKPVFIMFSYEQVKEFDYSEVVSKFSASFFSRDIFALNAPLKNDLYFYGRSALIRSIVDRHKNLEHTGLFGLRKSGKTSIVYGVQRSLALDKMDSIFFDCESPSVHSLRWFELLEKIIKEYYSVKKSRLKINYNSRYDEKNAAASFEEDMLRIYESKSKKSIMFVFDEIEHISPNISISDHWRDCKDFIFFWQTIRAFYQKYNSVFTVLIVGTNPQCLETPVYHNVDNPIYNFISPEFVSNFSVDVVSEMVKNIGGYMGLSFNPQICTYLYDDFGGHPFLTRQMCSFLHKKANVESIKRPYDIDKAFYKEAFEEFQKQQSFSYLEMIVGVLKRFYMNEYDMLDYLASGDADFFNNMAREEPLLISHLLKYGLISKVHNGYDFSLKILKNYVSYHSKNRKKSTSLEEKWAEISERRNKIEPELRSRINFAMLSKYGAVLAKEKILQSISSDRRSKLSSIEYSEIMSRNGGSLFFSDIESIVRRNWDDLKMLFESTNQNELIFFLSTVNKYRPDAHAREISEDDFLLLRSCFSKLENIIK